MKFFAKFYYYTNKKVELNSMKLVEVKPYLVSHIGSDCYVTLDNRLSINNLAKQAQTYANKRKNVIQIDEIKIFKANDFKQFINDNGNEIACIINEK